MEHDEDLNEEAIETSKDNNGRIWNIFVQTLQAHELPTQSFCEARLRME